MVTDAGISSQDRGQARGLGSRVAPGCRGSPQGLGSYDDGWAGPARLAVRQNSPPTKKKGTHQPRVPLQKFKNAAPGPVASFAASCPERGDGASDGPHRWWHRPQQTDGPQAHGAGALV